MDTTLAGKAVFYLDKNYIEIRDTILTQKLPDEITLAVEAVGICRTDLSIISGKHIRAVPPLIPGHEFSGRVIEASSLNPDIHVGNRVSVFPLKSCGNCKACNEGNLYLCNQFRIIGIDCDGGLREIINIPHYCAISLPSSIDSISGALVEPTAVAIRAIRKAHLHTNEKVVVLGAGTIGQCIARVLHAKKVKNIAILDRTESKLKLVYPYVELASSLDDKGLEDILDWTDGHGADIVFDAIGAIPSVPLLTRVLVSHGKIIIVGIHQGPVPFDLREFFFKGLEMIVSRLYDVGDFHEAINMIRARVVNPTELVTNVFSLYEVSKAFSVAQKRQSLKVIVHPTPNG